MALNKWLLVMRLTGYCGLVGEVVKDASNERDKQMAIRDAMGLRSPRTAIKRANSVLKWLRWSGAGYQIWPPGPHALRTFLADDGSLGVTASACGALLEALRFCKHVLRMPLDDDVVNDPILVGRCTRMLAERRGDRQARLLQLSEVAKLERFLAEDHEPWDVYLVGCCLFALFSQTFATWTSCTSTVPTTSLQKIRLGRGPTRLPRRSPRGASRCLL